MGSRPAQAFGILCSAFLVAAAGCSGPGSPAAPAPSVNATSTAHTPGTQTAASHTPGALPARAELNRQIAALRAATAPYHNIEKAKADGFVEITPCIESPAGGMGYHYGMDSRINDPAINYLEPEVLVYAPGPKGQYRLVAVEWVVPEPIWPGGAATPPNLFGIDFHAGPPPLLVLHAWIWHDNPAGMFEDFNPRVSCSN